MNVNNTLAALYALEKGKKSAETRGKKRIPVRVRVLLEPPNPNRYFRVTLTLTF